MAIKRSRILTIPAGVLDPSKPAVYESFQLNDFVNNCALWTAAWEYYKLNGVKINMQFQSNAPAGDATNPGMNMYVKYDFDGKSFTENTNLNVLVGCATTFRKSINRNNQQVNLFLKPRWLTKTWASTTTDGYALGRRGAWLDMNSSATPHFGLLYGFMNATGEITSPMSIVITYTYYISFKDPLTRVADDAAAVLLDNATTGEVLPDDGSLATDPELAAIQAQIAALEAKQQDLMDAHDSDQSHESAGDVSHPPASYY